MQRNNRGSCSAPSSRSLPVQTGIALGALALWSGFGIETASATGLFRFENRRENPGALRLLPEMSSFSTTENFDANGVKVKIPGLSSYKRTTFDLTAVYGVSRKLSIFGRVSGSSVSFTTTSPALEAKGSGLSEQGLGANYRIWESASGVTHDGSPTRSKAVDLQVQIDLPAYDNISARTSSPRKPLLGDGSTDMTLALFGTLPINQGGGSRMFILGGGGYTLRNNNHSNALPFQIQFIGLPERSGLLYRVGLHGFKSLTADANGITTLSPQSQIALNTLDPQDAGRSLIVDALNSSYLSARATLGYQWGPGNQVFASYLMPISGKSTATLSGIALGAQFRMQVSSGKTSSGATTAGRARPTNAYDLEARVKQANDRLNLIKIDIGEDAGVAKGDVFDIFRTNADGTGMDLVARGVVTGLAAKESVVNLRQYKKEIWIQPGFIARRITPKKTQ
jgi:hypothetical protein